MINQQDKLLENETILRWDTTGEPAKLWTANPSVAKEWRNFGFTVRPWMTGGWYAEVPVDRITYKPILAKRPDTPPVSKVEKRVKIAKDSEAKSQDSSDREN